LSVSFVQQLWLDLFLSPNIIITGQRKGATKPNIPAALGLNLDINDKEKMIKIGSPQHNTM
jgi:hypothetical protein